LLFYFCCCYLINGNHKFYFQKYLFFLEKWNGKYWVSYSEPHKIKTDSLLLFYFSFYYLINSNHKFYFQKYLFFWEKWNSKYWVSYSEPHKIKSDSLLLFHSIFLRKQNIAKNKIMIIVYWVIKRKMEQQKWVSCYFLKLWFTSSIFPVPFF
jgi:hypothetical protein